MRETGVSSRPLATLAFAVELTRPVDTDKAAFGQIISGVHDLALEKKRLASQPTRVHRMSMNRMMCEETLIIDDDDDDDDEEDDGVERGDTSDADAASEADTQSQSAFRKAFTSSPTTFQNIQRTPRRASTLSFSQHDAAPNASGHAFLAALKSRGRLMHDVEDYSIMKTDKIRVPLPHETTTDEQEPGMNAEAASGTQAPGAVDMLLGQLNGYKSGAQCKPAPRRATTTQLNAAQTADRERSLAARPGSPLGAMDRAGLGSAQSPVVPFLALSPRDKLSQRTRSATALDPSSYGRPPSSALSSRAISTSRIQLPRISAGTGTGTSTPIFSRTASIAEDGEEACEGTQSARLTTLAYGTSPQTPTIMSPRHYVAAAQTAASGLMSPRHHVASAQPAGSGMLSPRQMAPTPPAALAPPMLTPRSRRASATPPVGDGSRPGARHSAEPLPKHASGPLMSMAVPSLPLMGLRGNSVTPLPSLQTWVDPGADSLIVVSRESLDETPELVRRVVSHTLRSRPASRLTLEVQQSLRSGLSSALSYQTSMTSMPTVHEGLGTDKVASAVAAAPAGSTTSGLMSRIKKWVKRETKRK